MFVGCNTPNLHQETGLYSLTFDETTGKLEIAQKFENPKNIGWFFLQYTTGRSSDGVLYALEGGGINPKEKETLWKFRLDK